MKNMRYDILKNITPQDILLNNINTYPRFIVDSIKNKTIDKANCDNYLNSNNYNIVVFHCSRLTLYEIENIKTNGLKFGSKKLFYDKITNLPSNVRKETKENLINHIRNLKEIQAESSICVSFGKLDFNKDKGYDKIFTLNWGGETIYNYYDKGDNFDDEYLKSVKEELDLVSIPCIICVRLKNKDIFDKISLYDIISEQDNVEEYFGSNWISSNVATQIIDIVNLCEYDGIKYS